MQIEITTSDIRPIVEVIARETILQVLRHFPGFPVDPAEVERVASRKVTAASAPPERLAYTEPEAAELLGIHRNQLALIRRMGEIAFTRIGKSGIRYTRKQLEEWLVNQERQESGGR